MTTIKQVNDIFTIEKHILENALMDISSEELRENPLLEKYKSLTMNYSKLLRQSNKLLNISDSQQASLKRAENDIKNLLDNAGQGFLTFGQDLIINKEYSTECVNIFGRKIDSLSILELLKDVDEDQSIVERTFSNIFANIDPGRKQLYLQLLPDQLELDGKYIYINYKLIKQAHTAKVAIDDYKELIMMILTDITDKIALQNEIENERNQLKTIVSVVVNYDAFMECMKEYQLFVKQLEEALLAATIFTDNRVNEIYQKIHGFKGDFSIFNMPELTKHLHGLESQIAKLPDQPQSASIELQNMINPAEMMAWLNKDMTSIIDVLGQEYFAREAMVWVDKQQLLLIEELIRSFLPSSEAKTLLHPIKRLRYKNLKDLLKIYVDYVARLAEKADKAIRLSISGDDVYVDEELYFPFIRSLGHVFRNSIDHGIESIDERLSLGKDEEAIIYCSIRNNDEICITIFDDGQGIDLLKVKDKAISAGIMSPDLLSDMSDEMLMQLIFVDNLSTSTTISQTSGRGEGLACVKTELDKLGAGVIVQSEPGRGTKLIFNIPQETFV